MTLEIIIIIGLFIIPVILLIWAVKKRRRLFYNMNYVSETIWYNFQNRSKKDAMDLVQYKKQEAEEDDEGDLFDVKL